MVAMFQDLVRHKAYVNASLLQAIRQHEIARNDEELRKLLHHIILANRFWFFLTIGRSFPAEVESRVPASIASVAAWFRETHDEELEWVARIPEAELGRRLESSYFPEQSFSVAQGIVQVCMHSHGHRAQCATRLRALGGTPPTLDFVLWLRDRPIPDWKQL